jgi:hypothetical protein
MTNCTFVSFLKRSDSEPNKDTRQQVVPYYLHLTEKGPLATFCLRKVTAPAQPWKESATRFRAQVGNLVNDIAYQLVVIVEHVLHLILQVRLVGIDFVHMVV